MISLMSLLMAAGEGAAVVDPCTTLLPPGLARELEIRFPESRPPLAADSDKENRQFAAGKGNVCLSMAKADFNGDGRPDLALILPAKDGEEYRLVVVLGGSEGFDVRVLGSWTGSVRELYVDVAQPGIYTQTEACPFRPERGVVETISSRHQGFYFGQVESAADVYFLDGSQWRRVHVMD